MPLSSVDTGILGLIIRKDFPPERCTLMGLKVFGAMLKRELSSFMESPWKNFLYT